MYVSSQQSASSTVFLWLVQVQLRQGVCIILALAAAMDVGDIIIITFHDMP